MKIYESQPLSFKSLYLPNSKVLEAVIGKEAASGVEKARPQLEELAKNVDIKVLPKSMPNNTSIFHVFVSKDLHTDITNFSKDKRLFRSNKEFSVDYRATLSDARIKAYEILGLSNDCARDILISNSEISNRLIGFVTKLRNVFYELRKNNDESVKKYLKENTSIEI